MLVSGNCHRAGEGESSNGREQAENYQPTADQLGEASGIGEKQGEWQVQRCHIGIGKLLWIGKFFMAMVNHHHADSQAKQQQAKRRNSAWLQHIGL